MTYGYCVYHEIECDYKGSCIDCPHNTKEDTEWFKQDEERAEKENRPQGHWIIDERPESDRETICTNCE